ncbi:MAG: pyridoxine 5'-phosphate synthase [Saprospiraceae bacterium]
MVRLSVNINKIALIRNSRGANVPNLIQVAKDCIVFGAQGITVHPRPDERHIRWTDVVELKKVIDVELNIEGYPSNDFIQRVLDIKPAQVTLVPDPPHVLTSNTGWNTKDNLSFLKEVVAELKSTDIRVSLFHNPEPDLLFYTKETRADRIELYTGAYADTFSMDKTTEMDKHRLTARLAGEMGLGINAGHDLNLENLRYYAQHVPELLEVSIGHALVCDSMYFGLQNTIQMYLSKLN